MRILFVISGLQVGGAQKSTIEMINYLSGRYDMDLLVFNTQDMPLKKDIKAKIRLLTVSGNGKYYFERMQQSVPDLIKAGELRLLLKRVIGSVQIRLWRNRKYPEQIIWENAKDYIGEAEDVYDAAIACCQGLPTYYVADKVKAACKIAWMRNDAASQIHDREYSLRYYEQYDLINAVCERAARSLSRKYPEVAGKIAVFIDEIDARDVIDRSTRYTPEYDRSRINLCTVGRLCEQKGYFIAVDVCRRLVDRGYDVCWYAIGEGNLRPAIEKAISDNHLEKNFILAGELDNPFPYVRGCDIYVQTSLWEGYPRTLAEARILSKPIVATDFSGASEMIINGVSGIICGMNADEVSKELIELIEHPERRAAFTDYLSQEEYSYDSVKRFDDMIKDLLSDKFRD